MRAYVVSVESGVVAGRIYAVGEKYEYQVLFRVDPEYGACESEVTEYRCRSLVTCRGCVGVFGIRLVEAETAAACRAFVGSEKTCSSFG